MVLAAVLPVALRGSSGEARAARKQRRMNSAVEVRHISLQKSRFSACDEKLYKCKLGKKKEKSGEIHEECDSPRCRIRITSARNPLKLLPFVAGYII